MWWSGLIGADVMATTTVINVDTKMKKKINGFTLIEVMIVVAIIGILAGIAYPSYMESVRKSNRSDAKVGLNDVAQRLQRCYTAYSAFNSANCGAAAAFNNGAEVPTPEGFYNISANIAATTYTLTATPTGSQANDRCGDLTLTHTGARGSTGESVDVCW